MIKQTQKNIRKSHLYKHHNTSLIKLITLFAMAPPPESQYWHSAGQNNFLVTKVTRPHYYGINSLSLLKYQDQLKDSRYHKLKSGAVIFGAHTF